uniref:FYVE, RhoGEF and PH domain containing 5a n=1 Tax=Amphilophus citrinellus TaxID=61819 RepID=A0A3Q0RR35_AMPCI
MAEENQDQEEKSEAEDGDNDTGDIEERETETGSEKEEEILNNKSDIAGCDDTVKADDISTVDTTENENNDNDLNYPDSGNRTDDDENPSTPAPCQTETEDEAGEENEGEEEHSLTEKTEILCEPAEKPDIDQKQSLNDSEVKEADSEESKDCLHPDSLRNDNELEGGSEEHIYEEAGFDSEGENFVTLDRKTVVTRSRSYSGKVPGYVPETVPEETDQTHDYYTVALDKNSDSATHPQQTSVNCVIPSMKSRRFLLYTRSTDGPDVSLTNPTEMGQSLRDEIRMRRKDDTLSLPCMITSSGSFSQRSHQSSSGVSTPTSLVDIPPPFDLVYITKRPVTKSSPSLLIQHEPSDLPKKKKSSFKRFLALKFKKKTDSKGFSDGSVRSSRSSSESSHHGPMRVIELDRRSTGSSPQPQSRMVKPQQRPDLPSTFVLYKDQLRRKGDPKAYGRSVSRVESFEERSRRSAMPLPLTKPRSISFPSADTSDYENIPAMSSDYENIQIPGRPTRSHTVTEFFEDPNRSTVPCNENDGYVDMNSFPGIDCKPQPSKADSESAYTEPFPMNPVSAGLSGDEDHGRTSEEEEGAVEQSYERQVTSQQFPPFPFLSFSPYICLLKKKKSSHKSCFPSLVQDFRSAVTEAVDEEGDPVLEEQRLGEVLGVLPDVYTLHSSIFTELEERISQWEESPKVADVILSRRDNFAVFDTYISEYDRSMSLLEESCRKNPAFAKIVKKFEMFVKEGTLMKVSRKSRQPRHLFLMNDIMLYTYPQQDGKYRLKNTLSLSGMKVSKPTLGNVLNCLKIEVSDITITLSASSVGEREDWFHTLSRAIADHAAGLCTFGGPCSEAREKLWMALGEAAPVLVPVSHVMMCMNCTSDFSLTLRRHHCNACGKVVCRACSRNRYPLKYLKDRVAKVCDHCYVPRGLFQNSPYNVNFIFAFLYRWKCVSLGVEGSTMSGSLQRRKKSKRKWKRLWFLLKDKVLYTFTAREDKVASESLPLQGFTVKLTERPEGEESSNVFHLYHKKTLYYTFKADDQNTARRSVEISMKSVLTP